MTRDLSWHRRFVAALLLAGMAVLTGCSGATTSNPASTGPAASTSAAAPVRETASYKSTNVCVSNDTGKTITVRFTKSHFWEGETQSLVGEGHVVHIHRADNTSVQHWTLTFEN